MPERGHIMVAFLADPTARQTLYVIRPAVLSHKFRKRVVFRFCIRAQLHRMRKNCGTTAPSGPQHRPGSPHSKKQTTPPPKLPRDPSLYLSRKYCPAPFRENRCLTSAPRLFPNALANEACRSVHADLSEPAPKSTRNMSGFLSGHDLDPLQSAELFEEL